MCARARARVCTEKKSKLACPHSGTPPVITVPSQEQHSFASHWFSAPHFMFGVRCLTWHWGLSGSVAPGDRESRLLGIVCPSAILDASACSLRASVVPVISGPF